MERDDLDQVHADREALLERAQHWLVTADHAAEAAHSRPLALDRLASDAWWSGSLNWVALLVAPLVERPYGVTVADLSFAPTQIPAAAVCRWDDVVAELVAGAGVRLATSTLPAVQLVGLRALRWVREWRADHLRCEVVRELLGIEPPAAQPPGALYDRLVPSLEHLDDHAEAALAAAAMVLSGALGRRVFAHLSNTSARGWLWPWELGASMPAGVPAWGDDGNPVPVPVVVPHDWVGNWVDFYGWSPDATPGRPLVVDDPARVLAAWSGKVRRFGPMRATHGRGHQVGEVAWWLGRPVPMYHEDVAQLVEVAPAPEVVEVTHLPWRARELVEPEPPDDDEPPPPARDFLDGFKVWRSLGGWQ